MFIGPKITNTKQQIDSISRYYTHIDTNQISKAVATESFIVEPQDLFFVTDSEQNREQKTFTQVIGQANSELSLIKVLGEGGIGKSTFLYWIGKNYFSNYNIFLLERIYPNTAELLINPSLKVSMLNSSPIVFMIDNMPI